MADAFEDAWIFVKNPLDVDSVDVSEAPGFLYDDFDAGVDEDGFVDLPDTVKTPIAMFIHPKTGAKYPIQMTTPSFSHDFLLEMLYPEGMEQISDGMLPQGVAAMARVGYPDDDDEYEEDDPRSEFRLRYPPKGTDVEMSPFVHPANRRQGMGTALYDLANELGYRVKRSNMLSDEGQGLWQSLFSHADVDNPNVNLYWMGQRQRNRVGGQ
tara:strand:- start:3167 stop:3799 length:633 start_codon:yes stop_codon:yes gene_type:complete